MPNDLRLVASDCIQLDDMEFPYSYEYRSKRFGRHPAVLDAILQPNVNGFGIALDCGQFTAGPPPLPPSPHLFNITTLSETHMRANIPVLDNWALPLFCLRHRKTATGANTSMRASTAALQSAPPALLVLSTTRHSYT